MTIKKFAYVSPKNIHDTIEILNKHKNESAVMAGGTDLLIKINKGILKPKIIINLKKIKELYKIDFDNKNGLTIGSNVLLSTISKNNIIKKYYPTIAIAAKHTANVQIRNMATLVGNICNASPSADNIPTLLAMKAILNIDGPYGKKTIPLENFFTGPGSTKLLKTEIVNSVFIPKLPKNYGSDYSFISQRGTMDCSAVNVSSVLILSKKKFKEVNIFIGACAPTPIRAKKAEKILIGNKISEKLIYEASMQASEEASPISDIRSSSEYRKKMISILFRRSIKKAENMILIKKNKTIEEFNE